ncbi:MAG: FAD-binding oxidoreductase [Alphaproteobacteria bacterium]
MPDSVAPQDTNVLAETLGPGGWIDGASDDAAPYLTDWSGQFTGTAVGVARPADTAGVQAVMRYAQANGLGIVPQGGHTGLVGGGTPYANGGVIVLSLKRMNKVRKIDPRNNSMIVEAGVILQDAQQAALAEDKFFPLSLGAEGSCTIGGNLSTNAGGVNVIRYGNAREMVLGLEVVLPDGELWEGLRTLRKDNTGYHLKQMFIGAEGTLGVITAAALKLFPKPTSTAAAWIATPTIVDALALLDIVRAETGDAVETSELITRSLVDTVVAKMEGVRDPLADDSPFYVLMEVSTTRRSEGGETPQMLLEAALAVAIEAGHATDALIAQSDQQRADFWKIREMAPEALQRIGPRLSWDVTLPISALPEFYAAAEVKMAATAPDVAFYGFGHMGDGNLHYLASSENVKDLRDLLDRTLYDLVDQFDGSFSAEHGIGQKRVDELQRYKSPVEYKMMQALKNTLDPEGRMNPGKVVQV